MDYARLRQAILEASSQNPPEIGPAALAVFLETAHGEERGLGLVLKARLVAGSDQTGAPAGLTLIDEALPLVRWNPEATAAALATALALCYALGDADRARPYEEAADLLLLEHGAHPGVTALRHRLLLALGQIALLRIDYATAYWHFAQAANALQSPAISEAEREECGFLIHLHIATSCMRVRRYFEAQESLEQAEAFIGERVAARVCWSIQKAELLRQTGRAPEALELLQPLEATLRPADDPATQVQFHLTLALVCRDLGDLHRCYTLLERARREADTYHVGALLSEVERCLEAHES